MKVRVNASQRISMEEVIDISEAEYEKLQELYTTGALESPNSPLSDILNTGNFWDMSDYDDISISKVN